MGILSIFNKAKTESTASEETEKKTNRKQEMVSASPEKSLDGELNFSERLVDLKSALADLESHGIEIDEEIFENIMDMKVGDFIEYVNGGENIKELDVSNLHNSLSQILNSELNATHQGNFLKEIIRKPASKIAFAALILFLKFAPHAQAHEAPVKDNFDANHKIEKFDGGGGPKAPNNEKTYGSGAETLGFNSLENTAQMDLSNSFETDKADISASDAEKIKADLHSFLDKINQNNFHKMITTEFKAYISCDERPTPKQEIINEKGEKLTDNKALAFKRYIAIKNIVEPEIDKHDFSKSDLSSAQVEEIKGNKLIPVIPEGGITHITDLVNPTTGEKYTDKEVADMQKSNNDKYQKLLESCRYAKINLLAAEDDLKPIPPLPPTMENGTPQEMTFKIITLIYDCDQTIIGGDVSGSMQKSQANMAKQLQQEGGDKKANIKFVPFSDKPGEVIQANSFNEVGDIMIKNKSVGSSHEKAVFCATELLNNFDLAGEKIKDKKQVIMETDEAIKSTKADLEKLMANSEKIGAKVYFDLGYGDGSQKLLIDAGSLKDNFDKLYAKKEASIQGNISKIEKLIASKDTRGDVRRAAKISLEHWKEQLKDLPNVEFQIINFELPSGRIVNMAV